MVVVAMAGAAAGGRGALVLLAWEVSAEREEPWRRLVQELSHAARGGDEYLRSRRRLGVWAESVWLVGKPTGGGVAVVRLEASDPERVLGDLLVSGLALDTLYGGAMGDLFGFDWARLRRAGRGELLFAWRDDDGAQGERGAPKSPSPDPPAR